MLMEIPKGEAMEWYRKLKNYGKEEINVSHLQMTVYFRTSQGIHEEDARSNSFEWKESQYPFQDLFYSYSNHDCVVLVES